MVKINTRSKIPQLEKNWKMYYTICIKFLPILVRKIHTFPNNANTFNYMRPNVQYIIKNVIKNMFFNLFQKMESMQLNLTLSNWQNIIMLMLDVCALIPIYENTQISSDKFAAPIYQTLSIKKYLEDQSKSFAGVTSAKDLSCSMW